MPRCLRHGALCLRPACCTGTEGSWQDLNSSSLQLHRGWVPHPWPSRVRILLGVVSRFLLTHATTNILSARSTPLAFQIHHRMPQQQICLGLVAASIPFQPSDHILVQSNRDRPFLCPVKPANLRAAPIQNFRHLRQINVGVFFSCQCRDLSPLFVAEPFHNSSFREKSLVERK